MRLSSEEKKYVVEMKHFKRFKCQFEIIASRVLFSSKQKACLIYFRESFLSLQFQIFLFQNIQSSEEKLRMAEERGSFSLKSSQHTGLLAITAQRLRDEPEFPDVTLVCEDGEPLLAHKVTFDSC